MAVLMTFQGTIARRPSFVSWRGMCLCGGISPAWHLREGCMTRGGCWFFTLSLEGNLAPKDECSVNDPALSINLPN